MNKNYSDTESNVTYFLIGAGIGAVTALLFAPKAGSEIRSDIADATKRGLDQARDTSRQISEKTTEAYQTGIERANELAERAKESVNNLAQRGKDLVNQQSHQIASAIEAGKEGYVEAKRADQAKAFIAGA